jgi:glycosidase
MKRFFIYLILTVGFQLTVFAGQVERIEPLSWWTGMQNQELQLMFFGKNISNSTVSLQYPGVKVIRKVLTDNPDFQFIYLKIGKNAKPGMIKIVVKTSTSTEIYPYELKARKANSAQRESFTEADNVYLLMPDRFVNGNPANDSVPGYHQGVNRREMGERHGGDIEGVISKIPYLAEMGITALWTTPVFDNNDVKYSYHHYGCSDYYKIDPRMGTTEDYLRLSDTARNYNIKLILDVVPNHCSSAHWWMKNMPAKDWFNQWERYTSSNYRMMTWLDPHASESDLYKLTHGWFAPNMPDFNLQNSLLFDYLKQAYIYWIELIGFAGIRVDTYPYNNISTASKFIASIRNEYPKMNAVGECWMNTPQEIAYFQSGNNNKDGFDSKLTSVMDFPLQGALMSAFSEKEGWNSGMARLYMHFALDFAYPNTNLLMNFIDNHDVDRYAAVVDYDPVKYKMALAILMTVRGYPQIYYGTEIMHQGLRGSYEGHRFDFPGGWKNDPVNAFEAGGRTAVQEEIFQYLKKLLLYRKANPVLQSGKMKQFIPSDGVYVYFRYNDKKTVMIVVNNNEQDRKFISAGFKEMTGNKTQFLNVINGDIQMVKEPFILPAKSVQIYELKL